MMTQNLSSKLQIFDVQDETGIQHQYYYVPPDFVLKLADKFALSEETMPLADVLRTLAKYIHGDLYGVALSSTEPYAPGMAIEMEEVKPVHTFTLDEAMGLALIKNMVSAFGVRTLLEIGLSRLGFVSLASHDGQVILADMMTDDVPLDAEVWKI